MNHTRIRLALFGGLGRMNQQVLQCLQEDARFEPVAILARADSARLGQVVEICGRSLCVQSDWPDAMAVDVLLDFSAAAASDAMLRVLATRPWALVSGVTGLDTEQKLRLREQAKHRPVLHSANFSPGVAWLQTLVAQLATQSGARADIEIHEVHHRHKRDAPSGTALLLAEAAAKARGQNLQDVVRSGRTGADSLRQAGEIGISSERGGDVIGEHSVHFHFAGERLSLMHRAENRSLFARGALDAAAFLRGCEPGWYGMQDVIAAGNKSR
jgi:4-hydroxy-tetrahydrodipicolinate reductase